MQKSFKKPFITPVPAMKKICVIGLGYIGLPTAAMLANHGYKVTGTDINKEVVSKINNKEIHIEEPGLRAFAHEALDSGNLTAHDTPKKSDVFIVCVPTPLDGKIKRADLSYVINATESIYPLLEKNNLVILESTVPPGTTNEKMIPILEKSKLKAGIDFYVAHCPERVLPGNILRELCDNHRIIGGINKESSRQAKNIYKSFTKGKIYITDSATAEFTKLLENTYRDVNIALANELAKIAETSGINVWEAISLANQHPRVSLHYPGPGVGGHCIPIDPWFIYQKKPSLSQLIHLSRKINDSMPRHVLSLLKKILKGIEKPRITVLGITYKKDVDDIRESPALEFIRLARKEGYHICIHDPFVKKCSYTTYDLLDAARDSDCIVLLTDHTIFNQIDPDRIKNAVRTKNVLDTRNALNYEKWEKAGFTTKILGKPYQE